MVGNLNVMIAAALICCPEPIDMYDASQLMHSHEMYLSDYERDRIYRECLYWTERMYANLHEAERQALHIYDVDIREATVGAIEGAVCGMQGKTPYTVVIGGLLGAMARISGEAYRHWVDSKDYIQYAESCAKRADALQERLWRDE